MSEVPKLGKLTFVVLATNAVHERPCSTLYRVKTNLQSSMSQECMYVYIYIYVCIAYDGKVTFVTKND